MAEVKRYPVRFILDLGSLTTEGATGATPELERFQEIAPSLYGKPPNRNAQLSRYLKDTDRQSAFDRHADFSDDYYLEKVRLILSKLSDTNLEYMVKQFDELKLPEHLYAPVSEMTFKTIIDCFSLVRVYFEWLDRLQLSVQMKLALIRQSWSEFTTPFQADFTEKTIAFEDKEIFERRRHSYTIRLLAQMVVAGWMRIEDVKRAWDHIWTSISPEDSEPLENIHHMAQILSEKLKALPKEVLDEWLEPVEKVSRDSAYKLKYRFPLQDLLRELRA